MTKLHSSLKQYSPILKKEAHLLKVAKIKNTLSQWDFAPDFQIQYQERFSGQSFFSKSYSFGITVPLWFWKQGSQASSSAAYKIAQEYRLDDTVQNLIVKIKNLKGKVSIGDKTLKYIKQVLSLKHKVLTILPEPLIWLIKLRFWIFLTCERSLYRVKTNFYSALKIYVKNLSQLETNLGFTVSDLENK